MTDMDTDKNGLISLDEWKGCPKEFKKLDKDESGSLSKEEIKGSSQFFKDFKAYHKKACFKKGKFDAKKKFSYKDKNKDGILSSEEWPGCPDEFKKMDKNEDGGISLEEFELKFQFKGKEDKESKECKK